jgi:hypothetical protein
MTPDQSSDLTLTTLTTLSAGNNRTGAKAAE